MYLISLIGYIIIGKDKWRLNYYEYQIIFVSGLVKGAVSFALIMSCPIISGSSAKVSQINMSTNCMQITVIIVIYLGSLFWNSLLPKVLRNRRKKIVELKKEDPEHPSLEDSLLVNPKSIGNSVR